MPQSILIGSWVIFRQDLLVPGAGPLMGAKEKIPNTWSTFRSSHLGGGGLPCGHVLPACEAAQHEDVTVAVGRGSTRIPDADLLRHV